MNKLYEQSLVLSNHQTYQLPAGDNYHLSITVAEGIKVVLADSFCVGRRTIQLHLAKQASVVWMFRNEEQQETDQTIHITLDAQAHYEKAFFVKTQHAGTARYMIALNGSGAQATFKGRMLVHGAGKQQVTVEQTHHAPDTVSSVELNTVIDDEASFEYQGTITVKQEAVRSKAFQEQKNLLVSKKAHASSIPNLQVATHEVACGHGSAMSHVDDDHLFYLQSRGLSYAMARKLIIEGFIA